MILDSVHDFMPNKGFFAFGYQPEYEYVLKLDEKGVGLFSELDRIMMNHHDHNQKSAQREIKDRRKASLSIGAKYDFKAGKEATLIIELLFNGEDGYFILLDKINFPPDIKT